MRQHLAVLRAIIATAIIGLLFSCGSDTVAPEDDATDLAWRAWRNPNVFYYSYGLNAVWGSSARDVYAVGSQGVVIRYDGSRWTLLHCGGADLYGVWASSPNDVFAVGSEGTVLHYNGSVWKEMPSGTSAALRAVWGRTWYNVYAVGDNGTVLHYDGHNWKTVDTATDRALRGVCGNDFDVFAVGDGGTLLEIASQDARKIEVGTSNDLRDVGGCAATGLYIVGAFGTVLRYDGSKWLPVRSGTAKSFERVCGTGDGHLIIVASGPVIIDFDGEVWKRTDIQALGQGYVADVWGASSSKLFTVGGDSVWRSEESAWSAMTLPPLPSGDHPGAELTDIWGSSITDIYAAGGCLHYDGVDWTPFDTGAGTFEKVWGMSEAEVYGAASWVSEVYDPDEGFRFVYHSRILAFDGSSWSAMQEFTNKAIGDVWGTSRENMFAVGSNEEWGYWGGLGQFKSYLTILRYEGVSWIPMVESDAPGRFNRIWGSSANDIFAVGTGGVIYHYDGTTWNEMNGGTGATFYALWGSSGADVFAAGEGGVVVHYDGEKWVPGATGTGSAIYGLWGSAANDIWAVGEGGLILHYDGESWSAAASPTVNSLRTVWGSTADDVFAGGEYGTICHYEYR